VGKIGLRKFVNGILDHRWLKNDDSTCGKDIEAAWGRHSKMWASSFLEYGVHKSTIVREQFSADATPGSV